MWELDHKEGWAPNNGCFWTMVLEKTLESPLDCKEIKPVNPKGNQCWIFTGRTDADWSWSSNTLATCFEELTYWKRPWCWQRLRAGREGDERGWDGWMLSSTQWTWVWTNSRRWWWTGKPGVLQSMGSQRVGHDWVTVLVFWPRGMWDTSSPTRDQTCTPCIGRPSLNDWATREIPGIGLLLPWPNPQTWGGGEASSEDLG